VHIVRGASVEESSHMASSSGSGSSASVASATISSPTTRKLSDKRLFVSNLAPQLTEHDLLLLFTPHGTLKKLDLIFHRSGPQKGKPKGYAFVELAHKEEAVRAQKALEGRMIKGREIRINFASIVSAQVSF
jgi:RNA recognition motif-containing protein